MFNSLTKSQKITLSSLAFFLIILPLFTFVALQPQLLRPKAQLPITPPVTPPNISLAEVRINCGGQAYTDVNGNNWSADKAYLPGSFGYIGGTIYTNNHAIANTKDQTLYQSERWNPHSYKFDLPNGQYEVRLKFAEIYPYCGYTGCRIFNVKAQEEIILDKFDIYQTTQGLYRAFDQIFPTRVNNGQLTIEFIQNINSPKISAIEVLQLSPETTPTPNPCPNGNMGNLDCDPLGTINFTDLTILIGAWAPYGPVPQPFTGYRNADLNSDNLVDEIDLNILLKNWSAFITPFVTPSPSSETTIRINAGGPKYLDNYSQLWEADKAYSPGGYGYVDGQIYENKKTITGTEDQTLYQTERFSLSSYKFDVPNGNYRVTLRFAEIYEFCQNIGCRVFNVKIEGLNVLTDFDIVKETKGGYKTIDKTFTVTVLDQQLNVEFVSNPNQANQAKINAIEITKLN